MYKSKSGLSDEKTQNPHWFMKKFLVLRDFGINTLDLTDKVAVFFILQTRYSYLQNTWHSFDELWFIASKQ